MKSIYSKLVLVSLLLVSFTASVSARECIEENRIEDLTLKKAPERVPFPKFEIYYDKAGFFRYRLFATNGESIAISEDGYKSKSGCLNGMKSVAVNANFPDIVEV